MSDNVDNCILNNVQWNKLPLNVKQVLYFWYTSRS
jgi:hypothetical protein